MFKKIALGLAAVIALILIAAAFQPSTFRYERKASFKAKPAALYAQVADLHNWKGWSPWEKLDPGMKRDYSGAAKGLGAKYSWEGNSKIGAGNMEIKEAVEASKIVIALNFTKPMVSSNTAEFSFAAKDGGTEVTWAMHGPNHYIGKVFGLFMNMDKMIGKSFEEGFEALRGIVEK